MAMKGHAEFPELDSAIDAHAHAIAAGDLQGARGFLSGHSELHDKFAAKIKAGDIKEIVKLGRARIGMQHMSKIRFLTDGEPLLMVNRWREENGAWRIADSEDLSGKRSPWSDIEVPKALRSANGVARGAK
jgi:hypothetical protein